MDVRGRVVGGYFVFKEIKVSESYLEVIAD